MAPTPPKKPSKPPTPDSELVKDAKRARAEQAWAATRLPPAGQNIVDARVQVPKTGLHAPQRTAGQATTADNIGLDTHQVGPGETLASIAAQYGVTVAQLTVANPGVTASTLGVGALLVIPAS